MRERVSKSTNARIMGKSRTSFQTPVAMPAKFVEPRGIVKNRKTQPFPTNRYRQMPKYYMTVGSCVIWFEKCRRRCSISKSCSQLSQLSPLSPLGPAANAQDGDCPRQDEGGETHADSEDEHCHQLVDFQYVYDVLGLEVEVSGLSL